MAIGFSAILKGSKLMRKKLRLLAFDADKFIEKGLLRGVLIAQAEAQRIAPRKTARLERTGKGAITDRTKSEIRGAVGFNTTYALKLEIEPLKHASKAGFIGKPTKYIFPAIITKQALILNEIARGTRDAIDAARKL